MKRTREELADFDKCLEIFYRWRNDPSEENFRAAVSFVSDKSRPKNRFGEPAHERLGDVTFHRDQMTREWMGFKTREEYTNWLRPTIRPREAATSA